MPSTIKANQIKKVLSAKRKGVPGASMTGDAALQMSRLSYMIFAHTMATKVDLIGYLDKKNVLTEKHVEGAAEDVLSQFNFTKKLRAKDAAKGDSSHRYTSSAAPSTLTSTMASIDEGSEEDEENEDDVT